MLRPEGYLASLAPAIVERDAKGVFLDPTHEAFRAAIETYRPDRMAGKMMQSPNQQPPFAQERRSICDRCPAKPTCPIFQGNSPCRAKNLLKRPGMFCPGDPPKWGPVAEQSG